MKLFVCEKKVGTDWVAKHFWVGLLRLGLQKYPEYRIRRVMSRAEADKLTLQGVQKGSEPENEAWDLDTWKWEWPGTRTP